MIWVTIPTGQRTDKAVVTADKWLRAGFSVFMLTWDEETGKAAESLKGRWNHFRHMTAPQRHSFAVNQNRMIKAIFESEYDAEAIICGADDLWPVTGLPEILDTVRSNPGKAIWVNDGCLNSQMTHPIITRGLYEIHNPIFREVYYHNFVDTDLLVTLAEKELVVRDKSITFDHRHPIKTKEPLDDVYRVGRQFFNVDERMFVMLHGDKDIPVLINSVQEANYGQG